MSDRIASSQAALRFYARMRARNVARLRSPWWSPRRWFGKPNPDTLGLIEACVDLERTNNYAEEVIARMEAARAALSRHAEH
jgi:hypothetical protein